MIDCTLHVICVYIFIFVLVYVLLYVCVGILKINFCFLLLFYFTETFLFRTMTGELRFSFSIGNPRTRELVNNDVGICTSGCFGWILRYKEFKRKTRQADTIKMLVSRSQTLHTKRRYNARPLVELIRASGRTQGRQHSDTMMAITLKQIRCSRVCELARLNP